MLSRAFIVSIFVSSVSLAQSPKQSPSPTQKITNPDVSVSVLTLYKNQKRKGADKTEPGGGFSLQEAELQFQADVDPYLRAVALFGVHPAHEHEHEHEHEEEAAGAAEEAELAAEAEEQHYEFDAEEVYLETIGLPYVTIKAGRFLTALGKHNSLHAHNFPFIDAPLINQHLLGDHGHVENGLSAAFLVPTPWFLEATVQGVQGDSPTLFASESSTDIASVYRLRNLFELNDATTLDIGLSGAEGQNIYNERSKVTGADLSFKWRPTSGGKYQALALAAEYMQGEIKGRPTDPKEKGYAAWVQYQFAQRWWAQVRQEEAKSEAEGAVANRKISALIGFFPSEFSGIRLQYDQLKDADKDQPLNSVLVQANIVIGAHPAHTY